jgi:hypothetical protein
MVSRATASPSIEAASFFSPELRQNHLTRRGRRREVACPAGR